MPNLTCPQSNVHHLLASLTGMSIKSLYQASFLAPSTAICKAATECSMACTRSRRSLRRAVQRAVNEAAKAGVQLSAELEELPQLNSSPQGT